MCLLGSQSLGFARVRSLAFSSFSRLRQERDRDRDRQRRSVGEDFRRSAPTVRKAAEEPRAKPVVEEVKKKP